MAKRIVTIVLVSAVVSLGVVMTSAADDDKHNAATELVRE